MKINAVLGHLEQSLVFTKLSMLGIQRAISNRHLTVQETNLISIHFSKKKKKNPNFSNAEKTICTFCFAFYTKLADQTFQIETNIFFHIIHLGSIHLKFWSSCFIVKILCAARNFFFLNYLLRKHGKNILYLMFNIKLFLYADT